MLRKISLALVWLSCSTCARRVQNAESNGARGLNSQSHASGSKTRSMPQSFAEVGQQDRAERLRTPVIPFAALLLASTPASGFQAGTGPRPIHATIRSGSTAMTADEAVTPKRVVVTGAGGQTGQLVFRKLLAQPAEFQPVGIVRTEESRAALLESGVPADNVIVANVLDAEAVAKAIVGCDALVIGTSAKLEPTGEMDKDTGAPIFRFKHGQPEEVDWLGQKAQIDAAKACGPGTHVVVCSTMGGTDPSMKLNAFGRETLPDGSTKGGNIVLWKRKAEKYLIDSGLPYTIVHPGGLLSEEGGKREIVIGVDDDRTEGEQVIPREDVAQVMVQALLNPAYRGRSFDIRSKKEGEGTVTADFDELLNKLDGKNCDYNLGEIA